MSNPFSWYARYPRDYGEKTAHLSLAEHGAYSLLLDHYMSSGKPIAIATDLLSVCYRVCRAQTDDERTAVASVVQQYFTAEDDGCLHNKRADEELGKRKNLSETRTSVGKAGAAKRWSNKNEVAIAMPNAMPIAMANGIANPMANGMANGCTSTATFTVEEINPPLIPPKGGETKPKAERKAKGTRLPEDWCHDIQHERLAKEMGVVLYDELMKFRDYWASEGRVKANWNATFSSWLRNAGERRSRNQSWSRK